MEREIKKEKRAKKLEKLDRIKLRVDYFG
jgi:hypothetical protein